MLGHLVTILRPAELWYTLRSSANSPASAARMIEPNANPASISAEPPVRPFWWLKRLSLIGGTLLLLLAITWVLWDQYSRRELQARIDACRALGEPTTIQDLLRPSVRDEDNAALLYTQAANALSSRVYCPSASSYVFGDDLPYRPEWHALTKRAIELNSKPLQVVRQASRHDGSDWGTRLTSPVISVMLPALAPQRNLASLLADTALYEHFEGNDAQAVADVRTLLHQAHIVGDEPFLVSELVGTGIEALGVCRLEVMAGDLRIASESSTPSAGQVPQKEIRTLIAELLGKRQNAQRMTRAMRAERVFALDTLEALLGSSLLLKPVFRLDTARNLDRETEIAEACLLPTFPAARAALRPPTLMEQQVRNVRSGMKFLTGTSSAQPIDPALQTRLLAAMIVPPDRLPAVVQRAVCEQRMAAVLLAFRLYVIDHGRYPQTLQELTPKYLPALPDDPFAADLRPFGYFITANGKRPIVYSVGDDGIDQTKGHEPKLSVHLLKGWQSTQTGQSDDQYRDLSSWENPEPRQPMTDKPTDEELGLKAQPDNANQPDTPGDNPPGDDDGDQVQQSKQKSHEY